MRATYWSVTAFNSEIELLEKQEYPDFVKKIYGGREKCPKTGTEHFQGMIQCLHQVRLSKLKKWLPTSHLEIAKDKDALEKYVMKSETAVGEKTVVVNSNTVHGFAMKLVEEIQDELLETYEVEGGGEDYKIPWCGFTEKDWGTWFDKARYSILRKEPEQFYRFTNLPFKKLWCETARVWVQHHINKLSDSQTVSQTPV